MWLPDIFLIMNLIKSLSLIALAFVLPMVADACTSAIISAKASADGRPILWKHRDTSAENNFLYRVEKPGKIGYVGLFNGGDELKLDEAWMGMNDEGFAIMNTVAYNLPENAPDWMDREGYVMARALETCRTVDDFEKLLQDLPKPLGVRTNFGVLDANGNGAYFETDDWTYERFNLSDAPNGVLIRTNYAYSGQPDEGMGYIRHRNVEYILKDEIATGTVTPASLTEGVSRSFYHSLLGNDMLEMGDPWAVDQDFVPRRSSTASIAIEGLKDGETPQAMRMWANLGYPPCGHVVAVRLDYIPAEALPAGGEAGYRSTQNLVADELKLQVFPISRGSGKHYINLDALRPICEEQYQLSLGVYANGRSAF